MRAGDESHRNPTDDHAPEADAWVDSLDTVTDLMAMLDRSGRIVSVNRAWTAFADANGAGLEVGIGANYLVACEAGGLDDPIAFKVSTALRELLSGARNAFECVYPCHSPDEQRWFSMRASAFEGIAERHVIVLHHDMTARHRLESVVRVQAAAARDSERLLASAFDAAPIGMTVIDLEGRWLRVNDAYCRMLGYEREELLGLSFRDLTHPDDVASYAELLRHAAAGSVSAERELRYLARDGSTVLVNLQTEVILDDDRRPACTVSLLEDITERRRIADGLGRSEARLRQAEEMVGSGSWELSLDGETATWSGGLHRIHGVPVGEVPDSRTYLTRVHPEDREQLREALRRCTVDGDMSVEYRVSRTDGALRTLRVQAQLVASHDERESFIRGAALDVTDERAGFDAAPIGMLVAAPDDLRLIRVNDALCAMLGRAREELLTLRIDELTHPDDRILVVEARDALADGAMESYQGEKRYLRPDGTIVWATIYLTPVRDAADGSIRAFSAQVIDTTERRTRSLEIDAARVESLRSLAIASEYRDNDTHEHTERVGHMAEMIGRAVAVPEPSLGHLRQAAPLHDIGKIGISDAILLKPGRLTAEERQEMERHTLIGADILSGSASSVLRMAEEIALTHHEHWDGCGYPQKLRGDRIPLLGRIVAVADVFDALTHSRPYKDAWTVDRAVAYICGESARQFDPEVVAAFETVDHAALTLPDAGHASAPAPLTAPSASPAWTDDDGERASGRDYAASERDRSATERDQTAAAATCSRRTLTDAPRRATAPRRSVTVPRPIATTRPRTATRPRPMPTTGGRAPVSTPVTTTADTRRRIAPRPHRTAPSQIEADQRHLDRGHAAADRALAAADRDETAADRVAVTLERDLAHDELRRAQIDQLTGALGRELGTVALGREINRARHGNGRLVLVFVDVDGLKEVSAPDGHAAGDELLAIVVGAIQAHLRSYDPVVRFGGDEFVCALIDATPMEAHRRFVEIQATIRARRPGTSVSFGVAALPTEDTLTQLLERGDASLYRAKENAGTSISSSPSTST